MEAVRGVSVAVRNGGVSLPPMQSFSSSQHSRKDWHVVSEQSVRNPASEVISTCIGVYLLQYTD